MIVAASYTIVVRGTPAPKGSSRAFLNRKSGRAQIAPSGSPQNQANLKGWDGAVRDAAIAVFGAELTAPKFVDVALDVRISFYLARPGGHWGKGKNVGKLLASAPPFPRVKPDVDKLARATLDSLTGIAFDDDSRIAVLRVAKLWARPGHEGATIEIGPAHERSTVYADSQGETPAFGGPLDAARGADAS